VGREVEREEEKEEEEEKSSGEEPHAELQDLRNAPIRIVNRRATRSYLIRASLLPNATFINLFAVARFQRTRKQMDRYHRSLTYVRCYCRVKLRNRRQLEEVDLEPHINILVQYMLMLLSEGGFGTMGVFQTALASLCQKDFFLPGEGVFSKELAAVLAADFELKNWAGRIGM
jgi:hypothetical protein